MKNTLREMRVIWNCAFIMHYKGLIKYLLWLLMALLVIVPTITFCVTKNFHKAAGTICGPLSILFFCTWLTLLSGTVRQNSAANARLVPHLHQRLMQLTTIVGLAGVTSNAFFFSFFNNSFGWCFVFVLFYTIGTGWGQARHYGWPIALLILAHKMILENLPSNIAAMLTSESALAAWLVLGLLLGAVFIKSTFPRGGDRSWLIQQEAQLRVRKMRDPFAVNTDTRRLTLAPYYRALRMACTNRPENLAMLTLGPSCHWSTLLAVLLTTTVGVVLMKIVLLAFPGSSETDFFTGLGWGLASTLLIVTQLGTQSTAVQFANTKAEQSLYRLGAYAPPTSTLNRELAFGIVRAKLQGFFLMLAVALVCSIVMGVSYDKMIIEFSVCSLTLPFICLHLRDYSRELVMNIGYARIWQLPGLFVIAVGAISMVVVGASLSTWLIVTAASIALSAGLIAYRWRKMVAAPVVFPAGRIET